METWLSGRKHLAANEARAKALRGFKSHRLRLLTNWASNDSIKRDGCTLMFRSIKGGLYGKILQGNPNSCLFYSSFCNFFLDFESHFDFLVAYQSGNRCGFLSDMVIRDNVLRSNSGENGKKKLEKNPIDAKTADIIGGFSFAMCKSLYSCRPAAPLTENNNKRSDTYKQVD